MEKHYVEGTCGVCGEPAKTFVSMIAGGKMISAGFCDVHANAAGVLDDQGYGLLEAAEASAPAPRAEASLRCPVCDCSQRDFERQGRFGCLTCYTTFAGLLPDMLKRMHPALAHRGKLPRRATDPVRARGLSAAPDEAARPRRYEAPAPLPTGAAPAPRKTPRRSA